MYRSIALVALCASVVACAPTMDEHVATCQSYGFTPGTDKMARCAQREALAWQAQFQSAAQANMQYWQGQQALQQAQDAQANAWAWQQHQNAMNQSMQQPSRYQPFVTPGRY